MAVEKQPLTPIRAYLEYFSDLGVYDFFRNEEPGPWQAAPVADLTPATEPSPKPSQAQPSQPPAQPRPISQIQAAAPQPPAPQSTAPEPDIPRPIPLNDLIPLPTTSTPASARAAALKALQEEIGDCTRCPLAYAGRRNVVFADGDPNARLMFIGEGPGADEDSQGLPFVGKSGQLLNNMIGAMGLRREDVYIANIVKCRPPANRAPEPVEANTCTPFLARQIDIVQPEYIVALGATAAMYLLGVKQSLASLRGRFHSVRGAKALVTYHPAFLLRDPRQKVEAWKDLQIVMAAMGLKGKA